MFTETANPRRTKITICVIEHNPLILSHLLHVLQTEPQIRVCTPPLELGSSGGDICVFVVDRSATSVPLSQLSLQIDAQCPGAKILVVDHALSTEELCKLLLSGAHGFVSYDEIEPDLLAAIRTVANGRLRIAPEVLEAFILHSRNTLKRKQQSSLTEREQSIAELVGRQLTNKEIASVLQITESTVKFHLGNIFGKLGVRTRQLVPKLVSGEMSGGKTLLVGRDAEAKARTSGPISA